MSHNDGSEREKKSWREIDSAREKKSQRERTSSFSDDRASRSHAYRDYKTQLEKLFDTGKIADVVQSKLGAEEASKPLSETTEKRKALEALEAIQKPKEFAQAFAAYEQKHGFPESETLIAKVLDDGEETSVLKALQTLLRMHQEGRIKKAGSLRARVKTAGMVCDDQEVQRLVQLLCEML